MKAVTVSASKQYNIKIGPGLLPTIGEEVAALGKAERVCIVSDSNVWPLYGEIAQKSLEKAGFSVPAETKILVAKEQDAGAKYPYSHEKLCPVLAWFVVKDEEAAKNLAMKVLYHEGVGHTFSMHAKDKEAVRRFCRDIPVSRFLVNAPAAQGGIGAATRLFPALTLGCGAVGGSSSSENISPMHLINIRKVAWGRTNEDDLVEILTMKILERLK